jgi:putative transposase
MPHQLRDTAAGRFHVFTHCVWVAREHFRDEVDRLNFIRDLARVTAKFGWKCIAFCEMTSHYHLIVEVEDGVLPRAMHSLNLAYALEFNRRHELRGHTQFRRYGSKRIRTGVQLLETFDYVARNPVEAQLCATPGEWPWSSYAGTVGLAEPHSFVDASPILECFAWPGGDARAALRKRVEET